MIRILRDFGLTSEIAYAAGIFSIFFSIFSWGAAKRKQDKPSAQRWGIFVGLWAPTFMEIGNALKIEEQN